MLALWLFAIPSLRAGAPDSSIVDLFGTTVANAGDVDADGTPDVLVASGAQGELGPDDPSAIVFSGATGKRLLAVGRGWEINRFDNRSACGIGDANHDGHADFALLAWHPSDGVPGYFVTLFSGADGRVLWSIRLERPKGVYGLSVSCIHDVDGDRRADLAVTMWDELEPRRAGRLVLLSGWSGCTIAETTDHLGSWRWDAPAAELGDVDGDGITDVVIPTNVRDSHGNWYAAGVDLLSGCDLRRVHRFELPACDGARGAGDVDRDGTDDVLVSGLDSESSGQWHTFAEVVSGRDGRLLWQFSNKVSEAKGWEACLVGDVDGDGWRDAALSEYGMGDTVAGTWLLSGRDGQPLWHLPMPDSWNSPRWFGYALADAGDVDRDGHPDVAFGIATPWGCDTGCVEVRSGRDGTLLRRWTRGSIGSDTKSAPR